MKSALTLIFFLFVMPIFADVPSLSAFDSLDDENKLAYLKEHNASFNMIAFEDLEWESPSLKEQTLVEISKAVEEEEGHWSDTILEGDCVQIDKAQTLNIFVYVYNNEIFAYEMTITALGISTSDGCKYSEPNKRWMGNCPEGRIYANVLLNSKLGKIENGDFANFEYN